ncbi:MAG TPA: MoaD/ThiS family protein [Candidatus Thermoplasmatota archaeon]|nr:MoaD/ThiS family protein [Candidatus Thermoplasmatota archaeon]
MKVHASFRPRRQGDREVEVPLGATAGDVLVALGQPADGTVVVRGGAPIPETEAVAEGDRLLLLSAFSGG